MAFLQYETVCVILRQNVKFEEAHVADMLPIHKYNLICEHQCDLWYGVLGS
jgi:hypothetical protein